MSSTAATYTWERRNRKAWITVVWYCYSVPYSATYAECDYVVEESGEN